VVVLPLSAPCSLSQFMISLGIDLSLTATGCYCLNETGAMVSSQLIKTKPSGDKPIDGLRRLMKIRDEIIFEGVEVVCIEGMAFSVRKTTALTQLSGLNYLVREASLSNGIPFFIVAPTSLKKFITGKGNCGKDVIMLELFKRYGVTITDNNLADAFGLAMIGLAVMNKYPFDLIEPQKEVVKLIKKQL